MQSSITESCSPILKEINPVKPEIMALLMTSVTWVSFCNLESKWSFACSAETGY